MCKAYPYPRCSNHALKALEAAKKTADPARIKKALTQFRTSLAGIEELRASGRDDLADRYAARRKKMIREAKKLEAIKAGRIRVGVDIDNTMGDFTAGLREYVVKEKGLTAEQAAELFPDPTDYSFVISGWFQDKPEFLKYFTAAEIDGVYAKMKPYADVGKTIRKLASRDDVELHIVTARNQKWEAYTKEWLKRIRVPYRTITFTDRKEETDMDVYLDDAGYQLDNLRNHDKKVIAFHQLYNSTIVDVPRVRKWSEVPAMINKVVKSSR